MSGIQWLHPDSPPDSFPDPRNALKEPNGLVAAGGDLSPARLLCAYRHGIFPWYEEGQPVLWWSPDPRAVFTPGNIKISRSLEKTLRRGELHCTFDREFEAVIDACAEPRSEQDGTWITREMRDAYVKLHHLGGAHSVECWHQGQLAGGLYGVGVGQVFFGESMYSRVTDASKVALCALSDWLTAWRYALIDCQMPTAHLESLGAAEMPREQFLERVSEFCNKSATSSAWSQTAES